MLGTKTKVATAKIMVFSVGDLSLGVRLEGVQKVMAMPTLHKGSNSFLGVTQVEDQEIVVLDLHHTLYGSFGMGNNVMGKNTIGNNTIGNKGYLMVVKSAQHLYGLTCLKLPTMVEIPLTDLRPVPAQYRDRDTLGIAEQMAQVTLDKNTVSMLFLLDPNCLTDLVQQYDQEKLQQEYEALNALQSPVDDLDGSELTPEYPELMELTELIEPELIELTDLPTPVDALDLPMLTTADPFETDFQMDFS
jgi:chemotaxis signal transduction protein